MIRKIIIGTNPKDAMSYYIGMTVNGSTIVQIELDERHLALRNATAYMVYIKNDEGVMPWKRIEGMPVLIEYDCDFKGRN